ncbi:MAG: tetratricopeptide repeat protein [Pseudomonadota bacterium]
MSISAPLKVSLNTLEVDFAANTIGADGKTRRMEPRVSALLAHFIRHHGTVLSRADLIDAIWDGAHGADHSLTTAISSLRRLFADLGEGRLIETIPKRGYRLIEGVRVEPILSSKEVVADPTGKPVDLLEPTSANVSTNLYRQSGVAVTCLIILAVGAFWTIPNVFGTSKTQQTTVAAVTQGPVQTVSSPVLAVLPFYNATGTKQFDAISDGLLSDLIDGLSSSRELNVIARNSILEVRTSRDDYTSLKNALGASHILDGSIVQIGDQVRVLAKLIDSRTNEEVWSKSLSMSEADLLDSRRAIIRNVSFALAGSPTESALAPSANSEAYQHYLNGVYQQEVATSASLLEAKALFETAIMTDPEFGHAYARLAQVYLRMGATLNGRQLISTSEALGRAQENLERGLQFAPTSLDTLQAKWMVEIEQNDCSAAERTLLTALKIFPSSAQVHSSLYETQCCLGKWTQAYQSAQRATQLDPYNDQFAMDYAATLILTNRYDDAREVWNRTLVQQPKKSTGYRGMGHYNRFQGKLADAHTWYVRATGVDADLIWNNLYKARNLVDMGDFAAAEPIYPRYDKWEFYISSGDTSGATSALLDEDGQVAHESQKDAYAEVLSLQGDFDQARNLLEEYAAQTTGTIGPLFGEFPELDIPAPHLVYLRRRAGDLQGSNELSARVRAFINHYRKGGGDDYLLDVLEARLAAALGDDEAAAKWLARGIDRGFRIRRSHYFPEFVALGDRSGVSAELARMEQYASAELSAYRQQRPASD